MIRDGSLHSLHDETNAFLNLDNLLWERALLKLGSRTRRVDASVNPKTPEVATVDKRGFHVFTAYRCAKLQLQDWAPPILKIQPPASMTSFKFSSHRAELSVSSELTFGRAATNRWVSSSLLPTRLPITAPENIVSF